MAMRIGARGRVTIPKRVREALKLGAGDRVEFKFDERGALTLAKVADAPAHSLPRRVQRRVAELYELLRALD
jgi:AbrB family looped-hinge helix DNA binding protein